MSCSESWEISRSRYPESTSVAFSKSAWLFCKDKKKIYMFLGEREEFSVNQTKVKKNKTGWDINHVTLQYPALSTVTEKVEISFDQKRTVTSTSKPYSSLNLQYPGKHKESFPYYYSTVQAKRSPIMPLSLFPPPPALAQLYWLLVHTALTTVQ